ncbi:MAG: CsbD family protein, partial [Mycobacterium sp.]
AAAAIARVRGEEAAAKSAADEAGNREAVQEQAKADMDAQSEVARAKVDERAEVEAAAEEYSDAVDEHRHSVSDAVRTQAQANQARRLAETIEHTDDRS